MSFNPRAVFLIGPTTEYSYIDSYENQSYLCYPWVENDIATYSWAASFVDCSGAAEWPDAFLGNRRGLGRLYEYPSSLDDYHMPLLAENRIVTADSLEVWAMSGDLPAGCEPISSRVFTPAYATMWDTYPTACAAETDDYRYIRDDFYPAPTHKAYIDIYRVHDGVESARVSAIRSHAYAPMDISAIWTHFDDIMDSYSFTWRSQHTLEVGEQAKFIMQVSSNSSFSGVTAYEGTMSLVDDYYQGTSAWLMPASQTWYARCKRHDELIADPNTFSDSGWSNTVTITPRERVDETPLNGSPAWIPYYCYQDYTAANVKQQWTVYIGGKGGAHDQDSELARFQIAATDDFATVLYDHTIEAYVYSADGRGFTVEVPNTWYGHAYNLDYGTVYYARARNENSDGSVVSAWSNVFEMDGGNDGANHVDRNTYFSAPTGSILVPETHYDGDYTFYAIASEAVYTGGHTYVLLGKRRRHYDTGSSVYTAFGSLWLADYDGSTIALSQIGTEVEDWAPIGWPVHYDIVEFDDNLYAGWHDAADSVANMYGWCEITDGVVGTVQHIPYTAEAPDLYNWCTMAVIHGDLRVLASLDTGTSYIMGIANILSADTTMKVYPSIKTGYDYTKDPWLESIWFDYENYDATETGICWLGSGQSNAIWWVNK
jgi:hypothetical protein